MRLVYGRDIVHALPDGLACGVRERIEATLVGFPAATNGYLWQVFLGCYPEDPAGLPLYLQPSGVETIRSRIDRLQVEAADITDWLDGQPRASIDFLALSNILELSDLATAGALADAVAKSARPGSVVCLRSIFPPRQDIMELLVNRWEWDRDLSETLASRDRSMLCSFIRIFRTRR